MIDATQLLLNPNRCYKTVKNAKNMDLWPKAADPFMQNARAPLEEPDQAQYIRHHMKEFLERMVSGTLPLHLTVPP